MSGYFEDNKGNKSSIRLQSFLTLLFAFAAIGFMIYQNQIDYTIAFLLLVAAFAPKQIQNIAESKLGSNEKT